MQIAISDCAQIDQLLPIALKHKVGIEIQEFVFPENLDADDSLAHTIAERIQSISLRGFHGPFFELIPASRDRLVQQVARARYQRAVEVAAVVGIQHLILHTGYFPKTYSRGNWIGNSVAFWVPFLPDLPAGMQLHLENVYEDDYSLIAELVDKVNEALGREALTVCLDVGHVHANSSRSIEDWIAGLGTKIRYAHLHNNDGVLDDHWGLWKGQIDMARVLDLLRQHAPDAVWTVETALSDVERSLIWLEERGYL
ncbi:MAG: sugar phosphate isomerase/epimerase family protein [Anaerolineae bacterium]|jgi:sugar phosphate isomerase/epimerase